MTVTREQLLHLADRARRGVALPAEHDQLTAGITDMAARVVTLEAVCESNKRAYKGAVQTAWEYEAAIARVRAELALCDWPHAEVRADRIRDALDQAQQPTA